MKLTPTRSPTPISTITSEQGGDEHFRPSRCPAARLDVDAVQRGKMLGPSA